MGGLGGEHVMAWAFLVSDGKACVRGSRYAPLYAASAPMNREKAAETVMPGRLRLLALFGRLTAEQLIVIASRTQLKRFRDGDRVLTRGDSDAHDYFLLDGTVTICDADGNSRVVAGGTSQASDALAPLRPSMFEVRAIGPVVCAKMLRTEVALLREHARRTERSGSPPQADKADLLGAIEADLAADRLRLPSLPEIALRIRKAIANANCDNRQIADLLAADPAVAAKILKIANSPLCRGTAVVSTLREAVMRIGWVTVSELVVCFSLKDIFQADSPDIRERFAELAGSAVRIGATATVIAERVAKPLADQALIAGLLSNIGALPLLERAKREPAFDAAPAEVDELLARHAASVGESICRKWALGDDVARAVRHADGWTFAEEGPISLPEIVIVARYHTLLVNPPRRDAPRPESIKAMRILGPEFDPQVSVDIIRESKSRIEALLDAVA